jgi:protein-disulfide isomerase
MQLVRIWVNTVTRFLAAYKKALTLMGIFILCLGILTYSFPVKTATQIDPQLEKQVLEIIRKHPKVVIESIQAYQRKQQEELKARRQAFFQELKTDPQKVIGDSPTLGSPNAKVVLIEFSDFQCPYCAKVRETLAEFMAKYNKEVLFVYKNFPLTSIHPQALAAAQAAWAASQQGKFWEYHDALFVQQDKLSEELYLEIAKSLDLDLEKFNRDRQNATEAIEKDIELGDRLGVDGTPSFMMNDRFFFGLVELADLEEFLSRQNQNK